MMHHDFARKILTFHENRHLQLARVTLRHSPFDGGRPVRCRAGIYPPAFFFPGPADPIPPDDSGGGRRETTRWRCPEAPVPSSRPGRFG